MLRAPAVKLAGVLHAFVGDGKIYRLRAFSAGLASFADEDLFEAWRRYSVVSGSDDPSEDETIHKGLFAIFELKRRYSLDPDLATEKYSLWLDATGREDPTFTPASREAWRRIRKHLHDEERGTLH